jgi:menaquinone-dependent protoporphyrinogen IX oxidase
MAVLVAYASKHGATDRDFCYWDEIRDWTDRIADALD